MDDFLYQKQINSLGYDDETIDIPHDVCLQASSMYQFALFAVPVNPSVHDLSNLVYELPFLWGLGDVVIGRIIAPKKILYLFPSEELMNRILNRGPWSYGEWVITLNRWFPNMADDAWKLTPLWIQIKGIPIQFVTRPMIGYIGSMLAPVIDIDFDANTTEVNIVRIQVLWNTDKPLRFKRRFRFGDLKTIMISFLYEGVRNFCQNCGLLSHSFIECPDFVDSDDDLSSNDIADTSNNIRVNPSALNVEEHHLEENEHMLESPVKKLL